MKIAFAGKGGTGKTTLAAWTADYLARHGHDVWMIDADTALSLGRASGLSAEQLPLPLTAREDLIKERIGQGLLQLNPDVSDLPDALSVDVPLSGTPIDGITPGRKRLLVMGTVTTAGGGCACHANALLKAVLAHLIYNTDQAWVIVDLEAGVEHLGRGTVGSVDALVVVSESSLRSLETAASISDLAAALGLKRQLLALNRTESCTLPKTFASRLPQQQVAFPTMAGLEARMLNDASVLQLPEQQCIDQTIKQMLLQLSM